MPIRGFKELLAFYVKYITIFSVFKASIVFYAAATIQCLPGAFVVSGPPGASSVLLQPLSGAPVFPALFAVYISRVSFAVPLDPPVAAESFYLVFPSRRKLTL